MEELKAIKFIGGPLHGKKLVVNGAPQYVVVPVNNAKGLPKEDHRLFSECTYERTELVSGKQYFRLKSGYFTPNSPLTRDEM